MTPDVAAVFAFGVAIVIAVAAYVAGPLWAGAEGMGEIDTGDEQARWERQKRQALLAIKETELDYQMGKLSEEDLQRMRGRFEHQAMEAIAALERGKTRQGR